MNGSTMRHLRIALCVAAALSIQDRVWGQQSTSGYATSGYTLFGIASETDALVRYSFIDGTSTSVGTVRSVQGGSPMSGIAAAAYVPGHSNLIGFWNDPSDQQTKLVYINTHTAEASVVGNALGGGMITGAVAVKGDLGADLGDDEVTPLGEIQDHAVFALQDINAIDFEINDGEVVPSEQYAAQITVLGAQISNGYPMKVTMKVRIGDTVYKPFGPFGKAVTANVNDSNNPREFVPDETYVADTAISIVGRSWMKYSSQSGSKNSHWYEHMRVNSKNTTPQVKVLRDGDAVPDIPGFEGQDSIVDFVGDYIDLQTNTIKLAENQAIYLFELGVTNLNTAAADFQDLVVLVSLAGDPASFDAQSGAGPESQLIRVDHTTGEYEVVMTLSRDYDSLAALTSQAFAAAAGQELYALDMATQTEVLIGAMQFANVKALEFGGTSLYGYAWENNRLLPFDVLTGETTGSLIDLGVQDVGTIIFMRNADAPVKGAFD